MGDKSFAEQEQAQLEKARFLVKERELLTSTQDLKFNKGIIRMETTGITLT